MFKTILLSLKERMSLIEVLHKSISVQKEIITVFLELSRRWTALDYNSFSCANVVFRRFIWALRNKKKKEMVSVVSLLRVMI